MIFPNAIRVLFYRIYGIRIGENVDIYAHCFVGNSRLEIGSGTFVNYDVWFNTAGDIKIGKECNIACKVMFVTSTHAIGIENRRAGENISNKIVVGDGTWIGARTIILPGVTIGNGVIIGAGSVVIKNCEDNCLYAGNPARKIKELPLDKAVKNN